jgi:hypothetical protein
MAKQSSNYEVEWQTISIRTIKLVIFAIVVIGVSLLGYLWFKHKPVVDPNPSAPSESAARFIDLEGKVELKPRDEFQWKPATFKWELSEGDKVQTGSDSVAKIRFDDGTEITVQPDSIVVIKRNKTSDDKQALLVIESGESSINAEKSTNTATIATPNIRKGRVAPGSEVSFATEQQSGQDSAEVKKGYVEITTQQGKTVKLSGLQKVNVDRNDNVKVSVLPKIPPLIAPPNGQVFEFQSDQPLKVELKWRDVASAAKYHVQISENPLFGKISAENANMIKSLILIEIPKTTKKQYFWRVRSIDKQGLRSPWSDTFQFAVRSPKPLINTATGGDKTPPPLTITNIRPFFPYVQVEGKTEADAILTLDGLMIDLKDDGSFAYNFLLKKTGENVLEFVAEDPAGNATKVRKTVQY